MNYKQVHKMTLSREMLPLFMEYMALQVKDSMPRYLPEELGVLLDATHDTQHRLLQEYNRAKKRAEKTGNNDDWQVVFEKLKDSIRVMFYESELEKQKQDALPEKRWNPEICTQDVRDQGE